MKIYERIILDWDGAVLEEESFEYTGPLALCGGGGGGKKSKTPEPPPPAPKPAVAKDVTAAATEAMNDQDRRRKRYMGQAGTVLTSPLGASGGQAPTGKTMLGQ